MRVGRIAGFRGSRGEVTVRVPSGDASRWAGLKRVLLVGPPEGGTEEPREMEVEAARAYRDRLVLALRGVDGASEAAALRGFFVEAPAGEVPTPPEGTYFVGRLLGLETVDEREGPVGVVADVLETGGVDVLVLRTEEGAEVLVPLAREIVVSVDERRGRITVRMPEGLSGLNRDEEPAR